MHSPTPGTWEPKRQQFNWRIDHYEPGKRYRVVAYTPDGTTPENEANARLIAAAPDLLAVSKLLLQYINQGESGPDGLSVLFPPHVQGGTLLRNAIRKANGGDPCDT